MTQEELNRVLDLHRKWLNGEEGGKRADLRDADLTSANLKIADLRYADLSNADLRNANLKTADLRYTNLYNANLSCADLEHASLYKAELYNANLRNANLNHADLGYADLYRVDLRNANLTSANLSDANLRYADLHDANLDEKEQIRKGIILKESMIGFKKCRDDIIVTLEIPKGSIVFSINNSICRTNKAKVIDISNNVSIAYSRYNEKFTYELGKEIEIKDFDLQYNVEYGTGIHFCRTRKEAEEYY